MRATLEQVVASVGFSRALSRWATPEPPRRHRLRITDKIGVGPNLVELLQESSAAALAERLLPQLQLTTNNESLKLDNLPTQLAVLSDEEKDALLASLNS